MSVIWRKRKVSRVDWGWVGGCGEGAGEEDPLEGCTVWLNVHGRDSWIVVISGILAFFCDATCRYYLLGDECGADFDVLSCPF